MVMTSWGMVFTWHCLFYPHELPTKLYIIIYIYIQRLKARITTCTVRKTWLFDPNMLLCLSIVAVVFEKKCGSLIASNTGTKRDILLINHSRMYIICRSYKYIDDSSQPCRLKLFRMISSIVQLKIRCNRIFHGIQFL